MKKYILNFLFIFCTVSIFAAPEPYAHLGKYENIDQTFFKHFVYGEETTYQVCTFPLEEENENNHKQFLNALNIWLNTTENYIRARKNGEKDFKDILKILKNVKNLKRLPCEYKRVNDYLTIQLNSDLNVLFGFHVKDEFGSYNPECNSMLINKYVDAKDAIYGIDDLPVILHELGHVFGLADRYEGAIHTGSFIYNSLSIRPSIMMNYVMTTEKITCDDVDGFITSIDRLRRKPRTFKSFCNDDIILYNSTAKKIKPGYVYNYKEGFSFDNANYEADINVIYHKKSAYEKNYILDITLKNFERVSGTINLLKSLGFDTKDLDYLTQDIEVRIHAPVQETREGHKLPNGLTNIFLIVDGKQKQAVIINYGEREDEYLRFFYDSYMIKKVKGYIILPIMHYNPVYKHRDIGKKVTIILDESLQETLHNLDSLDLDIE